MAIARDTHGASGITSDTGKTVSCTIAGASEVLLVATYDEQNGGTRTMTYNGVGMTQIAQEASNPANATLTLWFQANPSTGTHNIVSGVSGGAVTNGLTFVAYTGASQSNPSSVGNPAFAGALSITATLSTTSSPWYFCMCYGASLTGTANATALDTINANFQNSFDSDGIAGSTSMTVSRSPSGAIGMVAAAVQTSGGTSTHFLNLLGIGS